MLWGHAIGIYLLAGVIMMGLGQLVRKRWEGSGKIKPLKFTKTWQRWVYGFGIALATLLWPIVVVGLNIAWLRNRRKVNRFLGYCEHATAFEPVCNACRRDIEREGAVQSLRTRIAGMERHAREKMAVYIKAHPECPKCGKVGDLSQYLDSVWVKCGSCGRRTFTPDPSLPEEVDTVPAWLDQREQVESFYGCSACKLQFKGVPPAADAKGLPLCLKCKLNSLRSSK